MNKQRWRRLSVRNWPIAWKLALAMLAIFLVAQVIILLVSDALVRRSLIQGEERELLERAAQQAELVRDFRDSHLLDLYRAAERNYQDLLPGNLEARRTVLRNGQLGMSDFHDLSLLDEDGRVLASTNPALEGQDFASAPWFAGVQRRQAGISHLQMFADLPLPVFVFYVPIPAGTGDSSLALAGRLPATSLWEIVDPVQVRESGYVFMADENAVTIAHGLREAGRPTHQFVLYAIGDPQEPHILSANQQHLYGEREITRTVQLQSLADFIRHVPPALSPDNPTPNIHHYYWDRQKTWKTVVAVPVGEPNLARVPHQIRAADWILCITVADGDFLTPLTRLRQGLLTLSGVSMLLMAAAAVLFSRTITRPIRRLADLATRVEQGAYDERIHLEQEDELGQLAGGLNTMLDRLAEALATQRRQLEALLHTADAARQDAETVSTSAEELAAATEELNASAEDVARTVQEMAQDASEQMNQVQRTAEEMQGLDREIGQVASLSQRMKSSSERMRALAEETERGVTAAREGSRRIEAVVKMIEKFSRQTNMLALNATIEAARAGEMGESFTVVADEVRRLAESSRQALAEVSTLNKAIRQSMDAMGGAMDQTREAIVEVVALIEQVARTASRQAAASHSIVEVVNGLAVIAEKNAAGSEEMAAAVEEQTAAFEEISASSQELAGLALRLQELAQQLAPEGSGGV